MLNVERLTSLVIRSEFLSNNSVKYFRQYRERRNFGSDHSSFTAALLIPYHLTTDNHQFDPDYFCYLIHHIPLPIFPKPEILHYLSDYLPYVPHLFYQHYLSTPVSLTLTIHSAITCFTP